MKGLLLKDFYALWLYRTSMLLMLAVVAGFSYFMNSATTFAPMMLAMYLMIMSTTLFQADDTAKWDRTARSAPLSARTLVAARYLFLLLATLAVLGAGFAVGSAVAALGGQQNWLLPLLATCGVMALMVLLCFSLMAPVLYKLGAEKGRMAALLIFLVPYLAGVFLMQWLEPLLQTLTALPALALAGGAALLGLAIAAASLLVSTRICARREL